ncbi:hypothetical protein ACFLRF_04810 [Candidatus Altiarchaeota archaeon]
MMKEFLKPSKGKVLAFNIIMLISVLGFVYLEACHSAVSLGGMRLRIPCLIQGTPLDPILYYVVVMINIPLLMILMTGPDMFITGIIMLLNESSSDLPRAVFLSGIFIIYGIIYLYYWWLLTCVLAKVYARVKKKA